jgi:hypothetical protein
MDERKSLEEDEKNKKRFIQSKGSSEWIIWEEIKNREAYTLRNRELTAAVQSFCSSVSWGEVEWGTLPQSHAACKAGVSRNTRTTDANKCSR